MARNASQLWLFGPNLPALSDRRCRADCGLSVKQRVTVQMPAWSDSDSASNPLNQHSSLSSRIFRWGQLLIVVQRGGWGLGGILNADTYEGLLVLSPAEPHAAAPAWPEEPLGNRQRLPQSGVQRLCSPGTCKGPERQLFPHPEDDLAPQGSGPTHALPLAQR